MAKAFLFLFLATVLAPRPDCANANQPLDRPFTLLNQSLFLLEAEYHRMIQGAGPRSYIFPRPCFSEVDSSQVCPESGGWDFNDNLRRRSLSLSPLVGYEYRYRRENVHAGDFGVRTEGGSGPLSFQLDARMFTEMHENPLHESYDREFVERQDESTSGSVAYSSYSRYRSNLNYDWTWGRLTVARDAAHWGPGLFTNLIFQQDAVPFNQLTFTTHLGPLTVQSLYGQLSGSEDWEFDTSSQAKSMYAHRYELRAGRNLVLGISEQLILYKVEAPFAFVPLIPLFITKATEKERLNNGNIAGDVSYRIAGAGSIYSEFLIDDIQSPTSLFGDSWSNKWAWMAGAHLIRDWIHLQSGVIFEYSRIEPWVYTHYVPRTAQTSHQGYPLGNQLGPNSQYLIGKVYLKKKGYWYASGKIELIWKGTDTGSSIEDSNTPDPVEKKSFLYDVGSPRFRFTPTAMYNWKSLMFHAQAEIGANAGCEFGIQFGY